MIARRWRGWADGPEQAQAYVAPFERAVRPRLERTEGFLDATLERVQDDDEALRAVRHDEYGDAGFGATR